MSEEPRGFQAGGLRPAAVLIVNKSVLFVLP